MLLLRSDPPAPGEFSGGALARLPYIVREGNIRKQLHQFAIETRAEVMVVGTPTRSPGRNVFKSGDLDAFVTELESDGNQKIIQMPPTT